MMPLKLPQWICVLSLLMHVKFNSACAAPDDFGTITVHSLDSALVLGTGPTAQAAVDASKPTLSWNGCDALWVDKDDKGAVHFRVAEARKIAVGGKPAAWYVLKDAPQPPAVDRPKFLPDGRWHYLYNDIKVFAKQPHSDGGSGNFALLVADDEARGRVYEVGWEEYRGGSGNYVEGRRIFFFRDAAGTWHFIGEGTAELQGRGCNKIPSFMVDWTDNAAKPVEIRETERDINEIWELNKDDISPIDHLDIYRDGVLTGDDSIVEWSGPYYTITQKTDGLDTVIREIEEWTIYDSHSHNTQIRLLARKLSRAKVLELNPHLEEIRLDPGARVIVPDPRDLAKTIEKQVELP